MLTVRSILFNALFYGWTTIMATVCAITLALPLRIAIRAQEVWSDGVIWLLAHIADIGLEIRGGENLPDGAAVVAAKHLSAWDTVVFHTLLNKPAIVLKKELLSLPLFGPFCRKVGMIPLDRAGRAGALRALLRKAREAADAGRPILIFPEGTRARPGEHLPLSPGVAGLYRHLGLPVVPVALNSGLFWPRQTFRRYPGTIVVEYLPAIAPGLGRDAFMARLETAIQGGTDALIAEAHAAGQGLPMAPLQSSCL